MIPTLSVAHLTVRYPNHYTPFENIHFTLKGGTIAALIGINGSGKSTLFNTLMGIIRPQTGDIRLNGYPIDQAIKHNSVAYVPQTETIDPYFPLTVADIILQGRYPHMGWLRRPHANDREHIQRAMTRLGINPLADRQIHEISGGQRKRVFLARSLAQESRIILLDEPFTGIDIQTEHNIMQLLQELRAEGYLILISTHHLDTIPDFCDHTLILNNRQLISGATADIFTTANLQAAQLIRPPHSTSTSKQ